MNAKHGLNCPVTCKTVFRQPFESKYPYDHASILAGLLKWKGIDPADADLLKRVAVAPTFESVISDKIVNHGTHIPDPGDQCQISNDSERMFADIPASVVRYIISTAKTEVDVERLLKDYKYSLKQ